MPRRPQIAVPDAGEPAEPTPQAPRQVSYASTDSLRLFAADYGERVSPWLPVVCLPGLTRTGRDFHDLAIHLSGRRRRPRRVVAFDYRGRGRSEWDTNPANYNPVTEMADVVDGMARLGIPRAVVIGTSRGGIVGMLMGVARPHTVAALVLNDIGPAIEARGLARIKSYVGATPTPDDWPDAAHIQRRLHGGQFTAWTDADWASFARLTYRDQGGRPVGDFDPALAGTLGGIELDQPVPTMWDEFRALKHVPILVLRGENSDLLSPETVAAMFACHPRVESMVVPQEGHPPRLNTPPILNRVSTFIAAVEGAAAAVEAVVPRPLPSFDLDQQPLARPPPA